MTTGDIDGARQAVMPYRAGRAALRLEIHGTGREQHGQLTSQQGDTPERTDSISGWLADLRLGWLAVMREKLEQGHALNNDWPR